MRSSGKTARLRPYDRQKPPDLCVAQCMAQSRDRGRTIPGHHQYEQRDHRGDNERQKQESDEADLLVSAEPANDDRQHDVKDNQRQSPCLMRVGDLSGRRPDRRSATSGGLCPHPLRAREILLGGFEDLAEMLAHLLRLEGQEGAARFEVLQEHLADRVGGR